MEGKIKLRLSLYGIVSAITFILLILTPNAGISVPLFILIQFVSIYLIVKNQEQVNVRGILIMIPIFILTLKQFISSNEMWYATNFLAIVILYSVMILILNGSLLLKHLNLEGIFNIIINIFLPFINSIVPFKWIGERSKNKEKNLLIKRISIGVAISIPCVLFLVIMLSSADLIFYNNVASFNRWLFELFNFTYVFKLIVGTVVGLYLFGHLYSVFIEQEDGIVERITKSKHKKVKGDIIILNILMTSILVIYTMFIIIQFKYLFSSGNLPNNLSYATYARRGFFELVFLSVLNIGLILLVTYLLQDKIYIDKNKWANLTKFMMIYLCIVTGVMLVSSYYRMSLYDSAYGFTRLRIVVYLFLLFEAVVLLATLVYIIKHNFNILLIYATIGLMYYLTLNVINIDSIISKRNIDMYFNGQAETVDMDYLMTLSPDAVPQIMRLLDSNVEIITRNKARIYLEELNELYGNMEYNWQSYNLSVERNKDLLEVNKDKLQFKY